MIQEDPGTGVIYVLGGSEQEHRPGSGKLDEMPNRLGRRRALHLDPVAVGELLEANDVVPVPAAELGAGSHFLQPLIQPGLGPLHPSGPETVDQDPAARWPRGVVHPMDLE